MPGTKSSAAIKAAEKAEFRQKVAATLERAHEASEAAYDAFFRTAQRNDGRQVIDACGWAKVIMYASSRRLQNALKALGETERTYSGTWYVSRFPRESDMHSIRANEVACKAACDVLRQELAGEGKFHVHSRMD